MANQTASAAVSSSPCLGGAASILRLQATSFAELRDAVRSGLPFSAFLALSKQLEISLQHLTAIFGILPRTLARRKEARHLNPQESDRLFGTRQVEEVLLCLNYGIFS